MVDKLADISASQAPSDPHAVTPAMVLDWLDRLQEAVQHEPWAAQLDFDGINALDVLLSPLYLTVLNSSRQSPAAPQPVTTTVVNRARDLAWHWKMAYKVWATARLSAPAEPADIVLWTRDITHTTVLVPIAAALAERGVKCRMLACQPKIFEVLRSRHPGAIYTMGVWPRIVRRARREGHRRARRLAAQGAWKLPPLANVSQEILEPAVRGAVVRFIPLVSEAVANAQAVVERLRPQVLVVGNDLTLEGRAGARVAASRGIHSAVFMHGSITSDVLQTRHCADRALVNGIIHMQELVRQGLPASRIAVCGAPHLDIRPRQARQVHPLLQARLGLSPADPWILVATSGPGHRISHRHHEMVIENLVRLCKALPDVQVVVKLHRKDRLEYYQHGLADCVASKLTVVAEEAYGFPRSIFEWLQGCRLVLTGASTVAVEAMLMEVPVITMDFCDEIHDIDFIEAGATSHVRTSEDLVNKVRDILAAGGSDAETLAHVHGYLSDAFYALDGRSSGRGAASLEELMSGRGTTERTRRESSP